MKRAHRRQEGKADLEIIEEATHLLRTAPPAALAAYYAGAIPFVLGLLYFWTDMSRNPFADRHLAGAALAMAALFLWMKWWQSIFARRMRAHIAAGSPPRWNVRGAIRMLAAQTILQPIGLLPLGLLLVAFYHFASLGLLLTLPAAWLLSLFHNVTALNDGEHDVKSVFSKAWRQWSLWHGQNLVILLVMLFFSLFVLLNWTVVCLLLPQLVKMLFGIESIFSRSPLSLLNTTFFAAMVGLTYLCVDPIMKVIYTLRCFYGESLQSGEDLTAELKRFALPPQRPAAVLTVLLLLGCAGLAAAADTTPPAPSPGPAAAESSVSPPELDRAISEVIEQRKYTWRMPREKTAEMDDAKKGAITRFLEKVGDLTRKWVRAAAEWLRDLLDKLFRRDRASPQPGSGYGWIMMLHTLLYTLVAAAIIALAILLYRAWRNRGGKTVIASEPIPSAPDITDENVGADRLPEDGWTKLARELLERGELRLAMRAFYLASLAHLAHRNLISIARFKSNRDYERELQRRGHSLPDLLSTFGNNISVFERIWYGLHEVNGDLVNRFAANVERIKVTG